MAKLTCGERWGFGDFLVVFSLGGEWGVGSRRGEASLGAV